MKAATFFFVFILIVSLTQVNAVSATEVVKEGFFMGVDFFFWVGSFVGKVIAKSPIDSFDPDAVEKLCDDKIDNDGDGDTDCNDSDCSLDSACASSPEICDDGTDNDGDGYTDCDDTDCINDPICDLDGPNEGDSEICDDSIDNDLDGYTDCDDPLCYSSSLCYVELSEEETTTGTESENDLSPSTDSSDDSPLTSPSDPLENLADSDDENSGFYFIVILVLVVLSFFLFHFLRIYFRHLHKKYGSKI